MEFVGTPYYWFFVWDHKEKMSHAWVMMCLRYTGGSDFKEYSLTYLL